MTGGPVDAPSLSDDIDVLYVGSERAEETATHLQRESDRIIVHTASDASAGRSLLASESVDCLVAEYELSEETGTEFLADVPSDSSAVPRMLVVAQEQEPTASEVVVASVTEYVRSETVESANLVDAIEDAVERIRERERMADGHEWFRTLVDGCHDLLAVVDDEGTVTYVSQTSDRILERAPEQYVGSSLFDDVVHPSDCGRVAEQFRRLDAQTDAATTTVEFRVPGESSWEWVAATVTDRRETPVGGFIVTVRNVVERKSREQRLERQRELFAIAQKLANIGTWQYEVESDDLRWSD